MPYRNRKRSNQNISPYPFTPAANQPHVQLTDLAAVFELTIPNHVAEIKVQSNEQDSRYTLDGTDPSAAFGFVLTASNDPLIIPIVGGRTRIKFIEETSGAVIEYQYGE